MKSVLSFEEIKTHIERLDYIDMRNIRDRIDAVRIERWMLYNYCRELQNTEMRITRLLLRGQMLEGVE